MGFSVQSIKSEGRPSFDTKIFLKLYLYGYLNGLRSSRKLEKECARNIELQWLLCGIVPNNHSISDFRKDSPSGLKKLFKLFVSFLKDTDLIAGETIVIDGTKSRAHNSKKSNFNQKKIDRQLAYIEEKTREYLAQLDQNDLQDNGISISNIQEKIARLQKNKKTMGLQSHQFNRTSKSKWRTQFDNASVQHQMRHKYTHCTGFDCQTQELELTLQNKRQF